MGPAVDAGWGSAAWVGAGAGVGDAAGTAGSVGCVGLSTAAEGAVVGSKAGDAAGVVVGVTDEAAVDLGVGAVVAAVSGTEFCWQATSTSAPTANATIASRLNLIDLFSGKQFLKAREMLGRRCEVDFEQRKSPFAKGGNNYALRKRR